MLDLVLMEGHHDAVFPNRDLHVNTQLGELEDERVEPLVAVHGSKPTDCVGAGKRAEGVDGG
jgi:hypothetical protein